MKKTHLILVGLLSICGAILIFSFVGGETDVGLAVSENDRLSTPRSPTTTATNGQVGTASIDDERTLMVGSLEDKVIRAKELARRASGLTDAEISEKVGEVFQMFYDPTRADEQQQLLRDQLSAHYGESEADFRMALINAGSDWEAQKALIALRRAQVGDNASYGVMMLDLGISSGQISYGDVNELVSAGHQLPADTAIRIAQSGNTELLREMSASGMPFDVNAVDPGTGLNALSAFIRRASNYPDEFPPEMTSRKIDELISIGVFADQSNGGPDALDHALQYVNASNAQTKLAIIESLTRHGVSLDESHRQLLAQMPDSKHKTEIIALLRNYL